MSIDVYFYIKNHSREGIAEVSIKEICTETKLSPARVKTAIKRFIKDGFIADVDKGVYKILDEVKPPNTFNKVNETNRVRQAYIFYSKHRNPTEKIDMYSYSGFNNIWSKIAEICNNNGLNIHFYIAASFNAFTEKWCEQTFGTKCPPPNCLAGEKKGIERYYNYLRYVGQYAPPAETRNYSFEQKILNDFKTWVKLASPTDEGILNLFIVNETLSPVFVCSIPDLDEEFGDNVMKNYNIGLEDLLLAIDLTKKELKNAIT